MIKQEEIEYIVKKSTPLFFENGKKLTKEEQALKENIDRACDDALYELRAAIETNLSIYFEIIKGNKKVKIDYAYNPEILKKIFKDRV